jgi:hypothetical protein
LSAGNVIENVVGGGGGDILTGNELSNTLTGNGGTDELNGDNPQNPNPQGAGRKDRVREMRDADFVLASNTLTIGAEQDKLFSIEEAELIGGDQANSFTISGWTQEAWLDGRCGVDTVISTTAPNYELNDDLLKVIGGGTFHLVSIEKTTLSGAAAAGISLSAGVASSLTARPRKLPAVASQRPATQGGSTLVRIGSRTGREPDLETPAIKTPDLGCPCDGSEETVRLVNGV